MVWMDKATATFPHQGLGSSASQFRGRLHRTDPVPLILFGHPKRQMFLTLDGMLGRPPTLYICFFIT